MNRPLVSLLSLGLIAVLFSGCVGSDDDPPAPVGDDTPDAADQVQTTADKGSLHGQVFGADNLEALAGATVNLVPVSGDPLETTVAKNGDYVFNNLEPGRYQVIVFAIGYHQGARSVDVAAGAVQSANFQLEPLPSDKPYNTWVPYSGLLGYGYTYWVELPVVGCVVQETPVQTIKSCGGARSANSENGEIPNDDFPDALNITDDVKTILVEMVWEPTGPLGEYLSMDLLCADVPRSPNGGAVLDIEHDCYWDTDNTQSPITYRVDVEDSIEKGYNWTGDWAARVFSSYGMLGTYDQTGIDAGVAYQQPFTIYVSIFHKEPAPEGYTGIPDGA